MKEIKIKNERKYITVHLSNKMISISSASSKSYNHMCRHLSHSGIHLTQSYSFLLFFSDRKNCIMQYVHK